MGISVEINGYHADRLNVDIDASVQSDPIQAQAEGLISRGVKNIYVNTDGEIIFRMTDGTEINLGAVGGNDHAYLANRGKDNQHPIQAITNLENTLNKKIEQKDIQILTNLEIEDLLRGLT